MNGFQIYSLGYLDVKKNLDLGVYQVMTPQDCTLI